MKKTSPFVHIALLLLCLLMTVPQVAFAGGADPEVVEQPQYDTRICGRNGSVSRSNTVRWTNIFSNGDPDTDTGRAYPPQTNLRLIGRDFWGCWVQVESDTDAGNGWVPIQSLNTRGVLGLTITHDNSGGCQMVNGQIVGCPNSSNNSGGEGNDGGTTASGMMTARWTNLYSSPDQSSSTGTALPPNTPVTVVSTSGSWSQVQSSVGNGWVPTSSLK